MKMTQKVLISFSILIFAVFILTGSGFSQQTAGELFEKALYLEEAKGDIQEAIDLYLIIVAEYADSREIASKAQLHIGLCYEKLGKSEAVKAYELVLKNFADQVESVSAARARLSSLSQDKPEELNVQNIISDTTSLKIDSLSLSPDGSKMAVVDFSKGQNIAVYDLSTKKLDLLTSYDWIDGWTYYAAWSPDGKEIAYLYGGYKETDPIELRVVTLDGESRLILSQVGIGIIPCDWTPDGKKIVGVSIDEEESYVLGLIPAGGGTFEELYSFGLNFDRYFARPTVSPDGKHILFETGENGARDIYLLHLENKSTSVLADHPADDYQPCWSPDGRHIVFLSQRHGNLDLWAVPVKDGESAGSPFVVKEDVQDIQILNWTQSGLAFVKTFTLNDIFLLPVDPETRESNGNPYQLAYTPTGNNRVPVWSPDGKQLAFFSSNPNDSSIFLVILSEEKNDYTRYSVPVYKFGQLTAFNDLRWMPDGSGLSFTAESDKGGLAFFQFNIDKEEWREHPLPPELAWTRTEWSPSGDEFIYAVHGFENSDPGIVERDLLEGTTRYLYRPEKEQGSVFRGLRFSRDYKWLAFQEDNTRIVIMNPEEGTKKILSENELASPAWSPDGRHLVVLGGKRDKNNSPMEMFILTVEDGLTTKIDLGKTLPQEAGLRLPDWSPDGKKIVFETKNARQDVLLMKKVISSEKR